MTVAVPRPAALVPSLVDLIREAGRVVMAVRGAGFDVETKGDESPVTAADREAERVILAGLRALAPGLPIVAEEAAAAGDIPDVSASFWLVDPIDGTKEFVHGNGEFTVNIALVECGLPRLGLVYAPALGRLFAGGEGVGAWVEDGGGRRAIATRPVPAAGLTVVGSRWHGDDAAVESDKPRFDITRRANHPASRMDQLHAYWRMEYIEAPRLPDGADPFTALPALGDDVERRTIEAGHMVMNSQPDTLAAVLAGLVRTA